MKRVKVIAVLISILLMLAGCKSAPKPDKIPHISALGQQKIGAKVEFTGWLGGSAGDPDLGIELNMSEAPNSYPRCFVGLKDGQKEPAANQQVCVRGQLFSKDEMNGGMIFRVNDAELINCY